ncbi:MAG: DUF2441 domain-containing protein [Candidatus Bathyarchaeia archaeon]
MQADESVDFYHVNRQVAWSSYTLLKAGDSLDVGGESNPYFRFIEKSKKTYGVTQPDGSELQVPGMRFLNAVRRGEVNSPKLPDIAYDLANHLVVFLRELIWEDVRSREFPHLPSRQRCIWLIPSIDGVRYWIGRMGIESNFQVLQLRVQGRIHTASESHLLGDSESLETAIQMARQYWLGIVEDPKTQEMIFEGRIRVTSVLDESMYA